MLEATTTPSIRNKRLFEIRKALLTIIPVLFLFARGGIASPTIGAHTLAFYPCGGSGGLVTTAIDTQPSGSTILAWVGRGNTNEFNGTVPLDTANNSYVMLGGMHDYGPAYPTSGEALYAVASAAGGTGQHVIAPMPGSDEITLAVVEVKNGGLIQDAKWNVVFSPPHTSLSVTTTNAATLVAIWAGDSGAASVTAVPNNGFTTVNSELLSSCEVEVVVATRDVAAAGTYNVTWTATPTQGAHLWLVAVQTEPLPSLRAQAAGGNVVISWPSSATSFGLETTSNLSAGNSWTPVTNGTVVINFQNTITNAISQPSQYYRLKKQ